jgi:spermidine synthase
LKYKDVKHVTLVDLDEGMTKLFQTNSVLTKFNANSLNNPKVEVLNKDAFVWAKNTKKQYDVVVDSRSFKLQFRKVIFLEFFTVPSNKF